MTMTTKDNSDPPEDDGLELPRESGSFANIDKKKFKGDGRRSSSKIPIYVDEIQNAPLSQKVIMLALLVTILFSILALIIRLNQ